MKKHGLTWRERRRRKKAFNRALHKPPAVTERQNHPEVPIG